jgi:hypothetical protein
MNRARQTWVAVVTSSLVVVATAHAQAADSGGMPVRLLTRPPVPISLVRRHCLELGDDAYTNDVPQVGQCAPLGVASRGAAGGRRWYSALFRRRWLLTDSANARADTVAESELVVFTANAKRLDRDTLLTPVWHLRFEPELFASVTPEVVSVNDGGALVGIDECVNGTGGCSQSFLLLRGDRWRVVHLAFVDSLNRRFPGAINHGFHVAVKTLHASAAVYSPSDANCCPSRIAEMQLRLLDDALEIVSLRLRPLAGPTERR